jgi:hypothetical protein
VNKSLVNSLVFLLRSTHFVILIFVVFACLCSNRSVLLIHLISVAVLIVHWHTNNGSCILTNWEYRLLGLPSSATATSGSFTARLLALVGLKDLSDLQQMAIIYSCLALSCGVSVSKLLI